MMWRATVLFAGGAVGALLGHWWADRELPTEFIRAEVVTNHVKAGDDLLVKFIINRRRSCAFEAIRIIFDSGAMRYVLPSLDFKAAPGPLGDDSYISPVHLPDKMTPGPATYRYQSAYYCNPLHTIWPIVPAPVVINFVVDP